MKVRIKSVPKRINKMEENFDAMRFQNLTSNPFKLNKGKKPMPEAEEVGKTYPEEKKGEANTIAEKGEYIAKADGKLYKIPGQLHKDGGTPIKAEEGDFIFSDSVKLTGEILKSEFDLNPNKEYSFADIVAKYSKMNDYQKLAKSTNPLDKKTGEMMVENLKEKFAKAAFLQEAMKGMPNGIPQISMPLLDKIAKVPATEIPEDSTMKKMGGQYYAEGGEKFKDYYDSTQKKQYTVPLAIRKLKNADDFYTKEVLDFMKKRDKEEGIDNDLGNPKDYTWGARHQEAYDKFFKDKLEFGDIKQSNPPGTTTDKKTDKKTDVTTDVTTDKTGDLEVPDGTPVKSGYRDLGYSNAETLALTNSLRPIKYNSPTRQQNYGLTEGLGIMSNLMPYNYQSLINESSRAGYNAIKANAALTGNSAIASANNLAVVGKLAESTSKIKGEEYNQNANLYNNNSAQIANFVTQIGQDKMQNAILYNNQVIQGRENLEANKWMRNKEFIQEYSNAQNNRSLRNAFSYLGASTNPNFPILDANMSVGFSPSNNPFNLTNFNNKSTNIVQDYNAFRKQLPPDVLNSMEEKDIFKYFMDDYRKTTK